MQTRIQQVPVPALAGGLALLGGVAVWQLGVELERAWLRSYDGPLEGESRVGERLDELQSARERREAPSAGERRRWVAPDGHPRGARRLRVT